MEISAEPLAVAASCVFAAGGVLIYIGRSLGTLQKINEAVDVALKKVDVHEKEISELKVGLAKVATKQEDCQNCP